MLNIFHTGGLTLWLSILCFSLIGWFSYQAYKAHNSGSYSNDEYGVHYYKDKIPYKQIPQFWGAVIVLVAYVVAMLFIASDYKGV